MIVLFDFDGVIADTETQYSEFWDSLGLKYLGIRDFANTIKGQTLIQIFGNHFAQRHKEQEEIIPLLTEFERNMKYDYIPGALEFMKLLKAEGIRSAIVTSSDRTKMSNAYKAHPELPMMVDAVLTSEDFSRSKPDPECFLKGMEILGGRPQDTIVFEDSFHGLRAGKAAGARVIGLATTNKREAIAPLCDMVIDDFKGLVIKDLLHK